MSSHGFHISSEFYFNEAAINEEICIDLTHVDHPEGTIESVD